MSVFTPVTAGQLAHWLEGFNAGLLVRHEGIAEGVQNSNFFVDTDHGSFVLTLFENVDLASLPFYLDLMAHLAATGIVCPAPVRDRRGNLLGQLNGRPAALFTRLSGHSAEIPTPAQCAAAGALLARLHLAAADFPAPPHPRGAAWVEATAAPLLPQLPTDEAAMLAGEIAHQAAVRTPLPGGVIHADLFRDNVLFDGERIGGVLDFYFAGLGDWLFDIAVTANDWCSLPDGQFDPLRLRALLAAYAAIRPLTPAEHAAWPDQLRAAALRFWLSRLDDFHRPRTGDTVTVRDPAVYRRLLRARIDAVPPAALPGASG